jgi:hypothetical protein
LASRRTSLVVCGARCAWRDLARVRQARGLHQLLQRVQGVRWKR